MPPPALSFGLGLENAVERELARSLEERRVEASPRPHRGSDAMHAESDVVQRHVREERLGDRDVELDAEVAVEAVGLAQVVAREFSLSSDGSSSS